MSAKRKAAAAVVVACLTDKSFMKPEPKRSCWTKEWIKRRTHQGCYENLPFVIHGMLDIPQNRMSFIVINKLYFIII